MTRASWQIEYQSLEVTDLLSPMITSVTYTDHSHGKSDELELTVHDAAALWRTGWWPARGDRLKAQIGYTGALLVDCGAFQVDDVTVQGPPDTVTIHALSAGHSEQMRTKLTRAFESTSLLQIVEQVADEQGMTVVGEIATDPIQRVTQDDETTLAFLNRLAEENGYVFNVRGALLCFVPREALEAQSPILTFEPQRLKRYEFRHTVQHTYIACEVSFLDPVSGASLKTRVYEDNFRVRGDEAPADDAAKLPDVLRYDDKGVPLVGKWQEFLQTQGTGPRGLYDYKVDSWYLDITAAGTARFQKLNGVAVNGREVGAETWRAAMALGFRADDGDVEKPPGDILYESIRVESAADAERKARALLRRANRLQATGRITVPGEQLLLAGVKVAVDGLYRLSGDYLIETSRHALTKGGGYTTEAELVLVP